MSCMHALNVCMQLFTCEDIGTGSRKIVLRLWENVQKKETNNKTNH